jgi:hypothetical protein
MLALYSPLQGGEFHELAVGGSCFEVFESTDNEITLHATVAGGYWHSYKEKNGLASF